MLGFQYKCLFRKSGYWIKESHFTDWLLELREELESPEEETPDIYSDLFPEDEEDDE